MSFLVHSQIWMSLSGLALIASVGSLYEVSLRIESVVVIFCGLMWVYLLDATASHSPEDETNQQARVQFFEKYARQLGLLRFICLVAAMYCAFRLQLPRESWFFLAASATASWLYSVGFRGRRIKSSSLNKTWIIALAWTGGVFGALWALEFLPLQAVSPGLLMFLVSILFFDTVVLDWRDQVGDKAHGVSSVFNSSILSSRTHLALGVFLMLSALAYLFWIRDNQLAYLCATYLISFNIFARFSMRTKSAAWFNFWVSSWRLMGLWIVFI